jgi:hypothetical protein
MASVGKGIFLSIGCETMSISRRKWTMCFKIRFALDWPPIGGIGHILYSRKGDAKGGWRGSASYNFGREAAPSGSQVSGVKTPFLNAKAAHAAQVGRRRRAFPTLGKRVRYRAKFGALAPCEFWDAAPSGVPSFRREDAVAGCKGGWRRASRTATARHPYLRKRTREG